MNKQNMLDALRAFVNQRSGMDGRNYNSRESFLSDYRPLLRNGRTARRLIREVELRESITSKDLKAGSRHAFSGRIEFKENGNGVRIEYCTGQYFPTEYRAAACSLLSEVLWNYWLKDYKTSDAVKKIAKRELGSAIAKWF
jgi:hypothetical protein